jgi:hypothetical protein
MDTNNEMRHAILRVILAISGNDWVPEELSCALGIQASRATIRGKIPGPGRPPAPFTEWVFEAVREEGDSIDGPLEKALIPFAAKAEVLTGFVRKHGLSLTVNCVIEVEEQMPELYLSSRSINLLAALGASFGMDIYS